MPAIFTTLLSFLFNPANRTFVLVSALALAIGGGVLEIRHLQRDVDVAKQQAAITTLKTEVDARDAVISALQNDARDRDARESALTAALASFSQALGRSQMEKATTYARLAPPVPKTAAGGVDTAALTAGINAAWNDEWSGMTAMTKGVR